MILYTASVRRPPKLSGVIVMFRAQPTQFGAGSICSA